MRLNSIIQNEVRNLEKLSRITIPFFIVQLDFQIGNSAHLHKLKLSMPVFLQQRSYWFKVEKLSFSEVANSCSTQRKREYRKKARSYMVNDVE